MRKLFILVLFPLCSLLACQNGQAKMTPAELEDQGYTEENAIIDAQEGIAKGPLHLLTIGEIMSKPIHDSKTGLLIETLGCEGSEAKSRYIKKYNEVILQNWQKQQKPKP